MWSDSTRSTQINRFFINNSDKNFNTLIDHLSKADIVPLDYRNLTPANQNVVNGWINNLTADQKNKILIIR